MLLFLALIVHDSKNLAILNEIKIEKVDIMKKKKLKLSISICVFLISFLLSSSIFNSNTINALVEEKYNVFNKDSFDRFTWRWNTTEVVSTESTNLSENCSLAIDSIGNVHIAWEDGEGDSYDIFYKHRDSASSLWTTSEIVSTESTSNSKYPSLSVDSAGNVHIAWQDNTNYAGSGADWDIFYKHWNASSESWTNTEVISTESNLDSCIPSLAVDSLGNVHIAWQDYTDYAGAGGDLDIFYKFWNSSTKSWNATEVVSSESTSHSIHSSVTLDSLGNVHIAWQDYTDYAGAGVDADIFYKHWSVSTSSWTTTAVVSTESTSYSISPTLNCDLKGNLHIAWWDMSDYGGSGTDADIFYKSRDAYTSSWTTTEIVSTESASDSVLPSLAKDSAGNIHFAWTDQTIYAGAGADLDIFYKRRTSSSSWTKTEVVSTESTADSIMPSIETDYLGNVHIAWYDETNYNGAGYDDDVFYKLLTGSPKAPKLAFIVPNPTDLSSIYLDWNNVLTATTYYIYRSTSYIWSVEELVPVTIISTTEYIDYLPSEGFYYYVIVAENFAGNSTLSNCQYIEYKLPHVQEFVIISSLIIGTFVILFVYTRTRKKEIKKELV